MNQISFSNTFITIYNHIDLFVLRYNTRSANPKVEVLVLSLSNLISQNPYTYNNLRNALMTSRPVTHYKIR